MCVPHLCQLARSGNRRSTTLCIDLRSVVLTPTSVLKRPMSFAPSRASAALIYLDRAYDDPRGADLEAQNALFIATALGPADIVETWPFSGQRRDMSANRSIDLVKGSVSAPESDCPPECNLDGFPNPPCCRTGAIAKRRYPLRSRYRLHAPIRTEPASSKAFIIWLRIDVAFLGFTAPCGHNPMLINHTESDPRHLFVGCSVGFYWSMYAEVVDNLTCRGTL